MIIDYIDFLLMRGRLKIEFAASRDLCDWVWPITELWEGLGMAESTVLATAAAKRRQRAGGSTRPCRPIY